MIELLKDLKKGQKEFGEDIAQIINFLLLTLTYVFGVGLTSIFAKMSGKHFLELKIDKNRESYWSDLNLNKKSAEDYYRQF